VSARNTEYPKRGFRNQLKGRKGKRSEELRKAMINHHSAGLTDPRLKTIRSARISQNIPRKARKIERGDKISVLFM
jgi:hypothetical protein